MKLRTSLTLVTFTFLLFFATCARRDAVNTSSAAGALTSNTMAARMFERRNLGVAGFHSLSEYIRPDVRQRLDKEPVSQDEEPVQADEPEKSEHDDEPPVEQVENAEADDDPETRTRNLDKIRFAWAKKKFGDVLAADAKLTGTIVVYADENFYDINKLLMFIDEGRDRIAAGSEVDANRIQVLFGGYRGVPQIEMWVVPIGAELPEMKPEDREAATSGAAN